MKAHIGVDVESGLVHTVTTTPANVADVTEVAELLHGKEKTVYADAGYIGADKRAPKRGRKWHIAARRGSVKAMPEGALKEATAYLQYLKAAVRSKVEHPFRVVKQQAVRLPEGALQGAGQEHRAGAHAICPVESVDGVTNIVGFRGRGAPVKRKADLFRGRSQAYTRHMTG